MSPTPFMETCALLASVLTVRKTVLAVVLWKGVELCQYETATGLKLSLYGRSTACSLIFLFCCNLNFLQIIYFYIQKKFIEGKYYSRFFSPKYD